MRHGTRKHNSRASSNPATLYEENYFISYNSGGKEGGKEREGSTMGGSDDGREGGKHTGKEEGKGCGGGIIMGRKEVSKGMKSGTRDE